ncbi:MAG: RNA methyltransferase [Syntrophomonas sp.]|nr:RNA methyltransferase [Syntrophomonas sp.]
MKIVSSLDNRYVKLAASLKQKKHRDDENMFLVEGKRSVAEAQHKSELLTALFLEEGLQDYELDYSMYSDVFLVSAKIMRHICSTETPQGIAAIIKKPAWSWLDVTNDGGIFVLLDRISDPGNIGSILRSCWALGVNGVLMTKGSADPFNPKVVRSTMGALLNVPVFGNVSDDQLDELYGQGYLFIGTDQNAEETYYYHKYPRKSVIIFGSEATGASSELKSRCDRLIKIPMNLSVDSLNVAAACAIIIAEVAKQRDERTRLALNQ